MLSRLWCCAPGSFLSFASIAAPGPDAKVASQLLAVGIVTALAVSAFACKPSASGGATRLADAASSVASDAGTQIACDCAALVPLDARPEWARISKNAPGETQCNYVPAGMEGAQGSSLSVRVVAGAAAEPAALERWLKRILATYPVVREQKTVALDGGVATIALGQAAHGSEIVVATRMEKNGIARAVVAIAEVPAGAANSSLEAPSWLPVLATTLQAACQVSR